MGNTFPSEKRHNWRVYSPAFLLLRDPLFSSGIKGSRQIKRPASRGKNRGHVPLESVTHVMRPSQTRALPRMRIVIESATIVAILESVRIMACFEMTPTVRLTTKDTENGANRVARHRR